MRNTHSCLLLVIASIAILTSCQKEISFDDIDTDPDRNIIGDWTFVGVESNAQTTATGTVNGLPAKVEATANYRSKNNSGTATFTADKFSYTNITYDVDTVANVKFFVSGFLVNQLEQPLTFNFPAASKSVEYVLNSTDSLTFSSIPIDPNIPSIPGIPPGGPQPILPSGPFGSGIAWSGDTLLIKSTLTFTQNITQPVTATANIIFKSTIKFLPR